MNLTEKWPRGKALALRGIVGRLNLCACGSSAHWECLLDLLAEAENHSDRGFYRDKWFEFGAKVLDGWALLEHGGAIGFAWLTCDGELLLEFLRDFGTEDHDLNDDSGHPGWSVEFSWDETENEHDEYSRWAAAPPKEPRP